MVGEQSRARVGHGVTVVIGAGACQNARVTEQPAGGTAVQDRPDEAILGQEPWLCLVWNDPVNTMPYVTYVFQTYFGFDRQKATRKMLEVHHEGRSVLSTGTQEEVERDVNAMHGYGLWATCERAG